MRIPVSACVAFVALTLVGGCDQRGEPVTHDDGFMTYDSADGGGDPYAVPPAQPLPGAGPEPPGASRVETRPADQRERAAEVLPGATAVELAELGAALDVPVSGIARSQLRDSYTEARGDRIHEALDIVAARGTPVLSAADGTLLKLFNSRPGGLMVYAMDSSERFILLYGHLDGYAAGLTEGMRLARGQVIGYVGTSGNASESTPHLHFGILRGQPRESWSEGTPVNPYPLLVGGAR